MKPMLVVLAAISGFAQEFEAVTIKPSVKIAPCSMLEGEFNQDQAGISYRQVLLAEVIEKAYGLAVEPAAGPPSVWVRRYDIDAKFASGAGSEQAPAMLRKMLSESFHLAVHEIDTERTGYWLIVAKSGPRMRPSSPLGSSGRNDCLAIAPRPGIGVWVMARHCTMRQAALSLSYRLGVPVEDRTALEGAFEFTAEYRPPNGRPLMILAGVGPFVGLELPEPTQLPQVAPYPPLRRALEDQLGLKLEPHVISRKALIVDRANSEPGKK